MTAPMRNFIKDFSESMPIILCHVVDLVIVAIFNFQTTQVYFVQDWKIPVKFTFKVFKFDLIETERE
jgi:hypothetical protein